jgi:hypothetical protein
VVAQGRLPEHVAPGRGCWAVAHPLFVLDVATGLADEQDGRGEAKQRIGEPDEERSRSKAVLGGDPARHECGERDGAVAGGLIDPYRQTTPDRADEVDLHDHGRRPGQALVHTEQEVRRDDPRPRRGEDDHQRHGQADEPAGDEDRLAAEAVGQCTRGEVGRRLGEPEGHDERQRRDEPGEPEDVGGEEREDRPLLTDHAADESAHGDKQRELTEVLAQSESDRWLGDGACRWPVHVHATCGNRASARRAAPLILGQRRDGTARRATHESLLRGRSCSQHPPSTSPPPRAGG